MDNPYLIAVGGPVTRHEPENDAMLADDLRKTIGWLEEAIAEYTELEGKIETNTRWFASKDMSHPKYETYAEIFSDQKERATVLLERMDTMRRVGIGEAERMSKEGYKHNKKIIDQFLRLDWIVREKRSEVAQESGVPF